MLHLAAREYLHYSINAEGAEAVFTFACAHRFLMAANQFPGHPKQLYDWKWFSKPGDGDSSQDIYGVMFGFVSAVKYTLRIEHLDATGKLIKILQDIDYESQDPTDWYREALEVFLV
jgi:hypothetical protein